MTIFKTTFKKRAPKRTTFIAFLVAVLTVFTIGSSSHTQFVLNELVVLGIPINLGTRLNATITDLMGLLPGYGTIIALGLLIAFIVTRAIGKLCGRLTLAWYWWSFAGGLALLTALMLMKPLLDVTPIAGARSTAGLFFQCLAGLIGGAVFGLLQTESKNRESK
ncbi:hypothetical protein EOPP23_14625 [Endozoicomonas sp. OPT23]|uniref:hypothetical protein n=1 Tax=Endozoicomonas sp. OPT23 TaxID=2072845 RepID=UPI00129B5D59|nr:hypothetical protein [Endozoicomonas sp. OPT23]MRI34226.1 hypothetical protein [Endozoicomonas sp. OPT23]